MRTTKLVGRFKRDYKRELRGRYALELNELLRPVIDWLVTDKPLPENYRDHALRGPWKGHRDCHIEGDLLLFPVELTHGP
jgi:mRNA interferase YafQ